MKKKLFLIFILLFMVSGLKAMDKAYWKHGTYIAPNGARVSQSESIINIIDKFQPYRFTQSSSTCGSNKKTGAKTGLKVWSNGTSYCSVWDITTQRVQLFN